MERMAMEIEGMSCGHCVMTVREALQGLGGVSVEDVQVGEVSLTFDPDAVDPDELGAAVVTAGFTVRETRRLR